MPRRPTRSLARDNTSQARRVIFIAVKLPNFAIFMSCKAHVVEMDEPERAGLFTSLVFASVHESLDGRELRLVKLLRDGEFVIRKSWTDPTVIIDSNVPVYRATRYLKGSLCSPLTER